MCASLELQTKSVGLNKAVGWTEEGLNSDFVHRQSLGELATLIPVSGSFVEYADRFVDSSLAFAMGWAYWYLWVTVSSGPRINKMIYFDTMRQVLANEYNVIALVIMYWTDTVPQWGWILIFWFLFLSISMLGVLVYGEVEFWLSL